jgi:hypothetical protein
MPNTFPIHKLTFLALLLCCGPLTKSQNAAVPTPPDTLHHSVARLWNEAMLQTIREDFARPPVQARNLFHLSIALYDAWAAYDSVAKPYFLGNKIGSINCPCKDFPRPKNKKAAREEAMSFAAFRVLNSRFGNSPKAGAALLRFREVMKKMGYDFRNYDINYASGSPAALGNYLGQCLLQMGLQDNSNEQGNYFPRYYLPINEPLEIVVPGNKNLRYANRWQPLRLPRALDQNGHPMPSVQKFQSPEWGLVTPFALQQKDLKIYERDGHEYWVYHDPGPWPTIDTLNAGGTTDDYKWNFSLVPAWSSHLDPADGVKWDISPASIGNVQKYPESLAELRTFYDFQSGKDPGKGHPVNPKTGKPYVPQIVPRGDYTRVLTQFWADGPTSETPPGHWFSILNYVNDQPELVRRFNGKGPIVDTLEWDVKTYFALAGAMHDAAITAWGIKGWYDGVRPLSALRYMADKGQSSDKKQPSYHKLGLPLVPGLIELVKVGDTLAGPKNANVGKIKFRAWRGTRVVRDTATQTAGVGWILAQDWVPYQLKTFVTPPFAGYISGHSTYSRAAAEALTLLTGDAYFPRGLGEFFIGANSNFLRLEKGPSMDITLQWATYRDASDQTSLSRIWGGIHPPFDDIPGRMIGAKVGIEAFEHAKKYFYRDVDKDGFYDYEDCDDQNAGIYPNAPELTDGIDNDCDGRIDEEK